MQQPESGGKRTAVAVVDPDRSERLAIRRILESEGLEIREAASAAEASALLDRNLRLVLVASSLGEAEVVALCEKLRASSRRSHFAISVMADARTLGSLEAFERAGAGDFLARPIEPALFRHRVRCLLRGARHLRDLQLHRAHLDDAQQLTGVGLWELDLESDRLVCSDGARRILGVGPARTELGAEDLRGAVHPGDLEGFDQAWRATLGHGAPLAVRHRLRDVAAAGAEARRAETRGALVLDEEGEPTLLRGATVLESASLDAPASGGPRPCLAPRAEEAPQPTLEARLRGAVERGDLALYYQPKAHADSRRITSLEALIRWNDAELGSVAPSDFIPVAESCELIVPIGLWVLRTACRQTVRWCEAGIKVGRVAVNVSPRQFRSPGFVESVLQVIEETGADPRRLELEITEGCLLESEHATATLEPLRSRGLGIAIDDFGTGYSSLQYLRRLPIDVLKIDRAFIRDLEDDAAARSLVASIISLAWSLGLRVVAEGVETEAQWDFLRDHGCDEIQGYALSCALPPVECEAFLRSRGTE